MKDEFPSGCGCVNIFLDAFKPYLSVVKFGDGFNEVFEGAVYNSELFGHGLSEGQAEGWHAIKGANAC